MNAATARASPVTLTGVDNGETYSCEVTATNVVGTSAPSASLSTVPARPVSPPPPKRIGTTGSATGLRVAATGPASAIADISPLPGTGGPYTLTATPVDGGPAITKTCTAPYDCALTGLSPGTSYSVTATATDSSGNDTPASAPSIIDTPAVGWVQLHLVCCCMSGLVKGA